MPVRRQKTDMKVWAIVPAAGIGSRMQTDIPKQYLAINDKPVLQHSIERLLACPQVEGVVVALHPDDNYWDGIQFDSNRPVLTTTGGSSRAESVTLALQYLLTDNHADADTWALVHDAVRPCVSRQDIEQLINKCAQIDTGGILAAPVKDTMKRSDASGQILETVARENLWHALTPQLFPAASLLQALQAAAADNVTVTDEASAMEFAGHAVQLVASSASNIKITWPGDLELAARNLESDDET